MKLPFQLIIPKRNSMCCSCNKPFLPGGEIHSLLTHHDEEFSRGDFCSNCFIPPEEKNSATFWKTKLHPNKAEKNIASDERALQLFYSLLDSETLEAHEEAYLLGLYLCRKKLLALRKEGIEQEGIRISLYENLNNGEILCVRYFDLLKLPLHQIQRRIEVKLKPSSSEGEHRQEHVCDNASVLA